MALGLWTLIRFGGELSFYARLYRVSRTARAFRAEYEHLAPDIAYAPSPAARLDVYSPAAGAGHPVVIFFHGGGWYQFDKLVYAPVAMRLVPHDLVVVMVDYTLYPDADVAQMARETGAAIAWTLEHIDEYGGDPRRVVVAGQSAGAHLAALAVMDPQYLAATRHSSAELRGVIGISGVYDIAALAEHLSYQHRLNRLAEVMGGADKYALASPLAWVRADAPPVLLLHGNADASAPISQSVAFDAALRAAGGQSELVIYPDQGHATMLFWALEDQEEVLNKTIVDWVREQTR